MNGLRKTLLMVFLICVFVQPVYAKSGVLMEKGYVPGTLPFFYNSDQVGLVWDGASPAPGGDPEISIGVKEADKELVYLLWNLPKFAFKSVDIYLNDGVFERAEYNNGEILTLENMPAELKALYKANLTFGTFKFLGYTISIPLEDVDIEIVDFLPLQWGMRYKGVELFQAQTGSVQSQATLKTPAGETLVVEGPVVVMVYHKVIFAFDFDQRGLPRFIKVPEYQFPPSPVYKLRPGLVIDITNEAIVYRVGEMKPMRYFLSEIVEQP